MNIIIIGCGRCGSRLARRLAETGNHVAVVDVDRASFVRLGADFRGSTYQGSGMDQEVLVRADVKHADLVFALTGGDNRNLLITQLVKNHYEVARAVARLHDPVRAQKYQEMGVETICTTTIISGILEIYASEEKFPDLPEALNIHGDQGLLQETKLVEDK